MTDLGILPSFLRRKTHKKLDPIIAPWSILDFKIGTYRPFRIERKVVS